MLLLSFFSPTKCNQVGRITPCGVSVILLTYLVAFISDYKAVINSINFVDNIIDRVLCKCILAFIKLRRLPIPHIFQMLYFQHIIF